MNLSVVIQAGGQSRRMGQNKALMPFRGQTLIERVAARMRPIAAELLLITNRPEDYQFLHLPMDGDRVQGKGPLGGLLTALEVARYETVAVVACDMPFVSPQLLQAEAELLESQGWDVVIPELNGGLEPLHAVYRKSACLGEIRRALQEERLRLDSWLGGVRVYRMDEAHLRRHDPDLMAFMNVNTPEEFQRAEELDC